MLQFNCTSCGQRLEAPQSLSGQAVQCARCGVQMQLAGAPVAVAPAGAVAGADGGMGLWSLVLAIASWLCFGPLTALPAVICGHVGMARIRLAPAAPNARGLCVAGLIIGYANLAVCLACALLAGALALLGLLGAACAA